MTTRMQVTLEPTLHRQAAARAAEQGISLAEFIRRLVARELSDEGHHTASDVASIIGIGSSGGSDVRTHKDRYLGEAIEADKVSRKR